MLHLWECPPVSDSFIIAFFSANLLLLIAARPCLCILHGSTGAKGVWAFETHRRIDRQKHSNQHAELKKSWSHRSSYGQSTGCAKWANIEPSSLSRCSQRSFKATRPFFLSRLHEQNDVYAVCLYRIFVHGAVTCFVRPLAGTSGVTSAIISTVLGGNGYKILSMQMDVNTNLTTTYRTLSWKKNIWWSHGENLIHTHACFKPQLCLGVNAFFPVFGYNV